MSFESWLRDIPSLWKSHTCSPQKAGQVTHTGGRSPLLPALPQQEHSTEWRVDTRTMVILGDTV